MGPEPFRLRAVGPGRRETPGDETEGREGLNMDKCPSCFHDDHDGLTCHAVDVWVNPEDPTDVEPDYCDCDKHPE